MNESELFWAQVGARADESRIRCAVKRHNDAVEQAQWLVGSSIQFNQSPKLTAQYQADLTALMAKKIY